MKKALLLLLLLPVAFVTAGQDITISFQPKVSGTQIDSVWVTNLKTNEKVKLLVKESLTLTKTSGIDNLSSFSRNVYLYPNPCISDAFVSFSTPKNQEVELKVYHISGQILRVKRQFLTLGYHRFQIQFPFIGFYTVSILLQDKTLSFKAVCTGVKMQECKISYAGSENTKQLKSVATGKTLSYSQGDILYYSVFSGKNNTIITDYPTMTKLYSVEFYECNDKDRQNYPIVKIGEQWWMAKNLAYLPSVSIHGMSGSTQYYVFDYIGTDIAAAKATVNYKTYGVLYTWQAAMGNSSSSNATPSGVKGVCPEGWHLPSNAEWTILANSLGGESVAGGKLRESGTAHWIGPNTDATNESGFSGLPGGSFYYMGGFFGLGNSVYWWSSTACPTSEYFIIDAWYRNSGGNNISFYPAHFLQINGFSIRCVKD